MSRTIPEDPALVTAGDLGDELVSFLRSMRAANVSPNTITAYGGAVKQFGNWLVASDLPTDVARIEQRHVETWINGLLDTHKPATAHNRYRGVQRFFNWYASIDDGFHSPMAKMRPPRLPQLRPRVLTIEEIRMVLATCRGVTFEDKRDTALLRVLFDTGARRHEVASLRWSQADAAARDIDMRRSVIHILGKGGKDNYIHLSDKTIGAIEDYVRIRRKHAHAEEPWLWLSRKGRLTDSGLAQMVHDRGVAAGIPNLHSHDFRHAATHHELLAGMNEADVMQRRSWDSPAMLRRYASTTANDRAIEAARKLALGDKV